jgi:hypothetical protein
VQGLTFYRRTAVEPTTRSFHLVRSDSDILFLSALFNLKPVSMQSKAVTHQFCVRDSFSFLFCFQYLTSVDGNCQQIRLALLDTVTGFGYESWRGETRQQNDGVFVVLAQRARILYPRDGKTAVHRIHPFRTLTSLDSLDVCPSVCPLPLSAFPVRQLTRIPSTPRTQPSLIPSI